jgi:hypothetical protein
LLEDADALAQARARLRAQAALFSAERFTSELQQICAAFLG